ncbi:phosphate acetyltransferase [Glaciimonas sp. PAMC28666]|uniref:phosphate acetyltransferase n=1 Tax=Glaciimonas sp. PAMC28666 TaxID=2807626 RepID=UPI0019653C18|nr:phosphate acetyltransferase [Glaciimonas sp. PAMC28666]QRX82960.1 phosphate acetyltransferase [Glaciimonas sp. PAMC28666]
MKALHRIIEQAGISPKKIVLCEGDDPRVLQAAVRAHEKGIAKMIIVGDLARIKTLASAEGIDLSQIALVDPADSADSEAFAQALFALRKAKGMTLEQARAKVLDPLCYANLMVRLGYADGSVAGAVHNTADVVRNAIQIIGVRPQFKLVSSFFLMMLCEPFHSFKGGLIFSDCALVVDPTAEELSEIAMAAADSARQLLMEEPRIAMLSFSTSGSAHHSAVDKVTTAARRVKDLRPELAIDGDVQLDAALVAEISQRKVIGSEVNGKANVLIFPNLDAGNIGYKMAERVGGAVAIGPLLQGLKKPANDLSRGCSSEDIFNVIAVTVVQAQAGMPQ